MRTYAEYLIESLRDAEEANAYLIAAFEEYKKDRDFEALMFAFRALKKARLVLRS